MYLSTRAAVTASSESNQSAKGERPASRYSSILKIPGILFYFVLFSYFSFYTFSPVGNLKSNYYVIIVSFKLLLSNLCSIFREQIVQIRHRKAAGEALLAEHVGDRLRLALLQFPDFFLDRAGRDEAVGVHGLRLANAVRAVNRLRLHRRVPPRVVKH